MDVGVILTLHCVREKYLLAHVLFVFADPSDVAVRKKMNLRNFGKNGCSGEQPEALVFSSTKYS